MTGTAGEMRPRTDEMHPRPDEKRAVPWAEIEPSRWGWYVSCGASRYTRCEGVWWRRTEKAARRKAQRLIRSMQRENGRLAATIRIEASDG